MHTPTPDPRLEAAPAPPEKAPKDRPPAPSRIPAIFVAVVAVAIAGLSIWYLLRPQLLLVQGRGRHSGTGRWTGCGNPC